MQKHFNKRQIAEFYAVSEQTIGVWMREGKLKYFRTPGGRPRFLNPEWREPQGDFYAAVGNASE